jgi:pentose-5-phosphate-3-epimerase
MGCLVEGTAQIINKETYFNRISQIIDVADELIAFHVNNTEETKETIEKARNKGISGKVYSYKA